MEQKQILEELALIAFSRLPELVVWDAQGLQGTQALQGSAGAAIQALEVTPKGLKLKLWDKLKALELLGKHFGMFSGGGFGLQNDGQLLLEAVLSSVKEVQGDELETLQQQAAAGHDLVGQERDGQL